MEGQVHTATFFWVINTAQLVPRTPMVVKPLVFTAFSAYSAHTAYSHTYITGKHALSVAGKGEPKRAGRGQWQCRGVATFQNVPAPSPLPAP